MGDRGASEQSGAPREAATDLLTDTKPEESFNSFICSFNCLKSQTSFSSAQRL